ncbi:MAG: hypothetical protein Q9224_004945, partial [Gallowayella concinna]
DAVAHMIEEIPNPTVEGPRIMIACVGIGTFTGFIFLMVLLFVAGPVEDVIESEAGPLLHIFFNATNSRTGSIILLLSIPPLHKSEPILTDCRNSFPLICLLFATTSIMTTSSRMTWAFARDGGLPFSRIFAKIRKEVLLMVSSAFNAIISASVVALGVSYAMPIAINCVRGRKMLGQRAFVLPEGFAWFANLLGIAYVIVTTVLFLFPPELPVTGSNM